MRVSTRQTTLATRRKTNQSRPGPSLRSPHACACLHCYIVFSRILHSTTHTIENVKRLFFFFKRINDWILMYARACS